MAHGNPDDSERSLLADALCFLTRVVSRQPKLTLVLALILSATAVGYSVCRMEFKTKRSDLIDPKAEFHKRWMEFAQSFGDASDVVVVVEGESAASIKQTLDDVGGRLAADKQFFSNVLYKVDPGPLQGKGLHYLSPTQLQSGLDRLAEFQPILEGRWELMRLDMMFARFNSQMQSRGAEPTAREIKPLLDHANLLSNSMSSWLISPKDEQFQNPWPMMVPVDPRMAHAGSGTIYFLNESGTMGFLKAQPTDTQTNFNGESKSLDRLREVVKEVAAERRDTKISLTGIPVLENDEMHRSQSDMTIASVLSYVGVLLVFIVGFRGWRYPVMAMIVMAFGMAWAFGFTTLAVGHLNILSVAFAAILIGLGDFSVCFISRYLELRHEGRPLRPALIETAGSVGTGIVTAATTTALSFFCATFTDFLGVAELGIIAGGGILLCMMAVFITLPAIIAIADKSVEPGKLPEAFQAKFLRMSTHRYPWVVLGVAGLILVGTGLQAFKFEGGKIASRVHYDHNLLNLQADGLESVEVQKRIFSDANDSLLYAVAVADTPQEARALRERFEKLPTVHHVEELASRLPAHTPDDTKLLVQAFRARIARLPQQVPQIAPPNPAMVGQKMEQLYAKLRKRPDKESQRTAKAIDSFLDQFERLNITKQMQFLAEYQYRMSASLLMQFQALGAAANPKPVTLDDLPAELTSRFVSKDGKWLVQVYPKEEIWDVEPLKKFIDDVRSVDPNVTGVPLQNYEASIQIKTSYEKAALYAFAVVWVVLLIDFLTTENRWLVLAPPAAIIGFLAMTLVARRVSVDPVILVATYIGLSAALGAILDFRNMRDAFMAMLPSILGGCLMFGILGLLGTQLNAANMIVLPLVLGIGVENGVHVVHDYRRQTRDYQPSASMINANLITSLTTMVGFGSMLIAAHRGLFSLGLVLTVGVACSLFVSMVLLPSMLTIASRRGSAAAETSSARSDGDNRRQQSSQRSDQGQRSNRRAA
jgi:hopanoid biosynthesis associated RND transporter like protein HpnN